MNDAPCCLALADAHLRGRADAAQSQMVAFLDRWRRRCNHLIILGDFFEYLAGRNRSAEHEYRPVLAAIARFAVTDYIEGNHDFDLSDGIPGLERVRLHPAPVSLDLLGLRYRLLHGDRADPTDWASRGLRATLQSRPLRWLRDGWLPQGPLFRFALAFAEISRRHRLALRRREAGATRRLALTELRSARAAAVLFGHTHQSLIERHRDGLLLNPGAARPGGSFLLIHPGRAELRRWPDADLLEQLSLP